MFNTIIYCLLSIYLSLSLCVCVSLIHTHTHTHRVQRLYGKEWAALLWYRGSRWEQRASSANAPRYQGIEIYSISHQCLVSMKTPSKDQSLLISFCSLCPITQHNNVNGIMTSIIRS